MSIYLIIYIWLALTTAPGWYDVSDKKKYGKVMITISCLILGALWPVILPGVCLKQIRKI